METPPCPLNPQVWPQHLSSTQHWQGGYKAGGNLDTGSWSTLIFQGRQLRPREGKRFVRSHTVRQEQSDQGPQHLLQGCDVLSFSREGLYLHDMVPARGSYGLEPGGRRLVRARGHPDASTALRDAAELTKCYHSAHEAGQAGITHPTSQGKSQRLRNSTQAGKGMARVQIWELLIPSCKLFPITLS